MRSLMQGILRWRVDGWEAIVELGIICEVEQTLAWRVYESSSTNASLCA